MAKKYWLMKSEPDVFSIDDLKNRKNQTEHWDGVRNYQARNFMRDEMSEKDIILFYHSNCEEPGIAGLAEVASKAYPDHTQFDKNSDYFDPKATKENPRWFMVDVKFKKKFSRVVTLKELKECDEIKDMRLLQKGNRLSVIPVTKEEYEFINGLS